MSNRRCSGCGKEKTDGRKYCPVCQVKISAMWAAGYLKPVPARYSPTTFRDDRGRKRIDLGSATREDDYGEESAP
jgi:uncharacterized Zn finger protein (UPF0148 family)